MIPGIRHDVDVSDADAAARRVSARLRGYCAVFKGRPRGRARRGAGMPRRAAPVSQNSTACDPLELPGMGSWQVQVRSTFQADQAWPFALDRRRRRPQAREGAFPIGFRFGTP